MVDVNTNKRKIVGSQEHLPQLGAVDVSVGILSDCKAIPNALSVAIPTAEQ
jgi:hypothetical protein